MDYEDFFATRSEFVSESGCRIWLKATDFKGYGRVSYMGRSVGAHRLAYEMVNGAIPDGMCVLHRCDTPSCVNVSHLFIGTIKDNNLDRARKGRTVLPDMRLKWSDKEWASKQKEILKAAWEKKLSDPIEMIKHSQRCKAIHARVA